MEKAMAPHSSTLAWKIPRTEEPGRLQSMGSLEIRREWATSLSLFTFMHWRRKWSSRCWQLDLWFLCLFYNQLEHLEVHGSCTIEAWLGEFWAYFASMWNECNCVVVLSILWHYLSLGLEWKLTFSSPVATAEFSKFAGILNTAL